MQHKKITIKPLNIKRESPAPQGYIVEKLTAQGIEFKLSDKAVKEIAKRLIKDTNRG